MSEIDYRAIRRRVILRWTNRLVFIVSLLLYIAYLNMPRYSLGPDPRDDLLRVIWFVVLVIHGVFALKDVLPFSLLGDLLQRQTEREAERLRARGYVVKPPEYDRALASEEKPKRAARLSDDGEIIYEDEPRELDDLLTARRRQTED